MSSNNNNYQTLPRAESPVTKHPITRTSAAVRTGIISTALVGLAALLAVVIINIKGYKRYINEAFNELGCSGADSWQLRLLCDLFDGHVIDDNCCIGDMSHISEVLDAARAEDNAYINGELKSLVPQIFLYGGIAVLGLTLLAWYCTPSRNSEITISPSESQPPSQSSLFVPINDSGEEGLDLDNNAVAQEGLD